MTKVVSYENCLKGQDTLTLEECESIYMDIVKQLEAHPDSEFEGLFKTLQERAIVYAGIRANWFNLSFGERGAADADRSRKHDLFIKAKNDLSKYMYAHKLDIDWEDRLGEERKRIGDFACYMTFLIAVSER